MFIKPHQGSQYPAGSQGGPRHSVWHWIGIFLVLSILFWQMLSLIGCSLSRKEYVVDYSRGNDVTAEGSRARPCQTEMHCRMLAEREGGPVVLDGVSVRAAIV